MRAAVRGARASAVDRLTAQQKPAPAPPAISLAAARTVRCLFPKYAATRWIDGTPETVTGKDELSFEIDTINLKTRTARIIAGRAGRRSSRLHCRRPGST